MIFSMLTAAAVMQGLAKRNAPQFHSATIERLADSLSTTDRMAFLKDASSVVDHILLQAGNATEHLEAADIELLEKIDRLIENDMYGSMKDSHVGDDRDLKDAIAEISACNAAITARQSATGDLGLLHQQAVKLQIELNRLQGIVDDKKRDNDTYWGEFDEHMQIISDPPACREFPESRGMASFDVYFEESEYSAWWTAARSPYHEHRGRYLAAHEALKEAISAFKVHKAQLDVKYCDYKVELEAACARFNECYASTVGHYTNKLVPRVKGDMKRRIEVFRAGETFKTQVRFLLAKSKTREPPPIDTSKYELSFPAVPEKTLCDLSTLTSDWSHTIKCDVCEQGFGIGHTFGVKSWLINDKCTNAITVQQGASVNVHLEYENWEHGCVGCVEQMYVGIRGQTLECIYNGDPNGHLHDDAKVTLENLAPGTYQIVATASWEMKCVGRTDGRWIATVHVQ